MILGTQYLKELSVPQRQSYKSAQSLLTEVSPRDLFQRDIHRLC